MSKKSYQVSVVDNLNITDKIKTKIQQVLSQTIEFPKTDSTSLEQIINRIGNSEIVLGNWNTRIDSEVLSQCPNIKYVGIFGTSMAGIDIKLLENKSIRYSNVIDYADEGTAEYVFARLLTVVKGIGQNPWGGFRRDLSKKKIGIIGLGAVGIEVAKIAKGFNMEVIYFSKSRNSKMEKKYGIRYCTMDELIKFADIISLNVPKNTIVLDTKVLSQMPDNRIIINTCLGTVVDYNALKQWLVKSENNIYIND